MQRNDKFKVVIIGAGGRANQVIYPSIADLASDGVELAGVCDIDKDRCNAVAERYGVNRRYHDSVFDYRRMIEEVCPDAVFAIGPPEIFYSIWMWCLEHGLNLYIEKPMGITIHHARSLAYMAEKNGCITRVSFQRRNTPLVEKLRDECLTRGAITHAVCKFYKNELMPDVSARSHMMDDCVHSIDTIRWMCGGEIIKIESHVKRVQVPDINFISATLHFDNGSSGYLINSWSSGKRIFAVEMHAPHIFVEAEHESKGYLYADGDLTGVEFDAKTVAGSGDFHVYTGVMGMVKGFVDSCKSGKQSCPGFSDSVKTMEVAEKILAQAILEDR